MFYAVTLVGFVSTNVKQRSTCLFVFPTRNLNIINTFFFHSLDASDRDARNSADPCKRRRTKFTTAKCVVCMCARRVRIERGQSWPPVVVSVSTKMAEDTNKTESEAEKNEGSEELTLEVFKDCIEKFSRKIEEDTCRYVRCTLSSFVSHQS